MDNLDLAVRLNAFFNGVKLGDYKGDRKDDAEINALMKLYQDYLRLNSSSFISDNASDITKEKL